MRYCMTKSLFAIYIAISHSCNISAITLCSNNNTILFNQPFYLTFDKHETFVIFKSKNYDINIQAVEYDFCWIIYTDHI